MNDLRDLLHQNAADAPADHLDVATLLARGRRRRRDRRRLQAGGAAALAAVTVAGGLALGTLTGDGPDPADRSSEPVGPVVRLGDARAAVEDRDYRTLATRTASDGDLGGARSFAGVTTDGLVVVTERPPTVRNTTRVTLLDPATGTRERLPGGPQQIGALREADVDRLVFMTEHGDGRLGVTIFDRSTARWSELSWPTLPVDLSRADGFDARGVEGGRLWVGLPRGGDEERFELWSVSLDDPADVRDERTLARDFTVGGGLLTWSDADSPGTVLHVRDLATGDERELDPRSGAGCSQLSLQSDGEHTVMQQYCGTRDGVRDDRVQVVGADGEPVVTVRADGLRGAALVEGGVVLAADGARGAGTYVYDLDTGGLLRLSRGLSPTASVSSDGGTFFTWDAPAGSGASTQRVGELL